MGLCTVAPLYKQASDSPQGLCHGGVCIWARAVTAGYIHALLQGVLHPEDARMAVPHGVQGIIVSNHGGRQLDTAVTGLDVLSGIIAAVGGRIPVLVDGGIRRGTDVYKALALGASAVLVGRPVLYALAVGGEETVHRALDMLHKELANTMALMGTPRLEDIKPGLLAPVGLSGLARLPAS